MPCAKPLSRLLSSELVSVEKTFEAVYENGILRPLVPLQLANAQHVQVTIVEAVDEEVAGYFDAKEWEASTRDDISLQDVRIALYFTSHAHRLVGNPENPTSLRELLVVCSQPADSD